MADEADTAPPRKADYTGAPACFVLEQMCRIVARSLGEDAIYQVGSSLERPDYRDVDLRVIMDDAKFDRLFGEARSFQHQPFWLLLCTGISAWFRERTGLVVDFQIQRRSHANERHDGRRDARGFFDVAKRPPWFDENDPS